ncbi:PREDICTED: spermatogenesis-associated protein 31D1-like, partial [Myotis davidii]|uniref:spermatogenesis-associated protein 31D1-like n=1 Tax=Myotis davidii TaxID=225400 RepID=UPI0007675B77
MVAGHSICQRRLENVQKVHFLRKKCEKTSGGQLPGTVHSSQHSFKQNPVKSHTELEKRSLPSSVGGDYCLNTSQELPSLECGAQQMRKPHITKCQMGMLSALPTKVLESNERFKSKDTSSHSLAELKLKSEKKDSEAQGQSTDMSHDSDSSTCKASLLLPSLECRAQQMRKPHITKCQMGMLSALPTKVLESNERFKSKDTSSHSLAELKLKSEKKDSEAQGQSTDMSHDSDSSTCKASLTPAQDVSSGHEEVAQLLHVHSEDSTVSTEKQQEPWLPRQALRSCQDQNFPPA